MLIKDNLNGFWAHVFQHLNWQFVAHRQSFSILFTGSKNHTSKGWIPNRISFLLWVTKKRAISKIEWREKTRSKQMGVKLLVIVQVHDRALLPANRILNLHRQRHRQLNYTQKTLCSMICCLLNSIGYLIHVFRAFFVSFGFVAGTIWQLWFELANERWQAEVASKSRKETAGTKKILQRTWLTTICSHNWRTHKSANTE